MESGLTDNMGSFLFYTGETGQVQVQVVVGDETVWTSQKGMAELFGVEVPAISKHLKNVFETGELQERSTVSKMEIVQIEGSRQVKRKVDFYNLDAIIAVGYRVNSYEATQFRIWANRVLKEYMIKGFAIDDDRLKQGRALFDKDYFDELVERIREIRASERRFYQKITDIYATSIDYDSKSPITQEFFATVQNKLHYAITKQTAAEIIYTRAMATKPNMGLTAWANSPNGKILKSDIKIAKNYLTEAEIKELELIVNMYLDFAELQARKGNPMRMHDWVKKLDSFIRFNEYELLENAGKVSNKIAQELAESEFDKFRKVQDREYISDFDRFVADLKGKNKDH